MPAAGLLRVDLIRMYTPITGEEEAKYSTTTPYLFSLGKHRMFLDIPTHSSEQEIKAVAASYARTYYQAFSQTPRQWLDPIIDRKHHSALFGEHVVWRSQLDIEVDTP